MLRRLIVEAKHGCALARRLVGKERLTPEEQRRLSEMRADNARSDGAYRPGPGLGWSKLVREFEDLFCVEGIEAVERQAYNARFSSFPPGSSAYYQFATFQLYQQLRQRDHWQVFDKLKASQRENTAKERHIVTFDGVALSWDVLISLQNLFSIAEEKPGIFSKSCALLDLGAGWGRIGHVLLRINPNATYIDADLPETLLIAESYLPKTLPGVRSYGYSQYRKANAISRSSLLDRPGIHFIGTQMLPLIEDDAVDVFVNVASFQEMTNSQVEKYFQDINRLTSGCLYIQQFNRTNKKDGFAVAGSEFYPFPSHWDRRYLRSCPHIPEYFEALLFIKRVV